MKHLFLTIFLQLFWMGPLRAQTVDPAQLECERFQAEYEKLAITSPQSYIAQKNMQRALHEVNALRLEAQRQENRLLLYHVAGGVALLLLSGWTTYRMRRRIGFLRASEKELEAAVSQAKHSIHVKNLFLSNMSHEIRTPLNALSGFSSILTSSQIDGATRTLCNEIIQQNSDLLLKLIDDVVDLSSMEKGILQFRYADIEVVSVCCKVTETVERIKQTEAAVVFDSALDSLILHTDEARLQQLLINLLINATKFTSEGSIRLTLEVKEGMACFAVTDTGCGIAPEEQQKVFNRFETLNHSTKGTGLGLSIARLIVEKMGGTIWVDPTYTDGARFCFTHPLPPDAVEGADRKEVAV